MKFEMTLGLVRRKGANNKPCIAPFINGWNIWNIPEKQWTPVVATAIERAYILGRKNALEQIKKELDVAYGAPTGKWGDVEDVT
jgi:hypothetical protein